MAFAWWKVHRSFAGIQGRVMRIIPEKDYAQIMGIECVHINKDTTIEDLRTKLMLGDIIWQ